MSSPPVPRSSSSSPPPPTALSPEQISLNIALHLHASSNDFTTCKSLLESGVESSESPSQRLYAQAWWEDESEGGWSALHWAASSARGDPKLVRLLLRRGAVWNAVDELGITAAEVAWSLNDDRTYRTILEEGVRHTILTNILKRKAKEEGEDQEDEGASSSDDDDEDAEQKEGEDEKATPAGASLDSSNLVSVSAPSSKEVAVSNDAFLTSRLVFEKGEDGKDRCVDVDGNVVMAAWESDIMERTAHLLCSDQPQGFSILNVGFGLGIIDTFIRPYSPSRHVIIEPHPDALEYLRQKGFDKLPGVEVWDRKWEDCIHDPGLGAFDAVYWDTFSQDYEALNDFFEELPNILNGPDARFSFFHGLAGTNPFLYDVYTRVAELALQDLPMETRWEEIRPRLTEETWKGTLRKYWDLDTFRIPLCQMSRLD